MASINDSILTIVVKAKNQASAVLNDFNTQAGRTITAGKASALAVQAIGVAAGGLAVKMGVDAVKAAVNFESKMSEVRKTTGFSADETKKFGKELLEMSKTLPISTDALGDIAAVAGQLGIVGTQNIKDFTEIIGKATIALPEFAGGAEQIALVVAKAQNVFRLSVKESENLLSVWNDLSNTTAANAAEISRFVENVGGAAKTMNMTIPEVSALGAALVSMGEDGSDAGTRVSSAIIFMQKHLNEAAALMGISTEQLKKDLDKNALSAVTSIIKELEKIPSATDRNLAAIEIFGQIGGKVMTKLTGNLDQLNSGLVTAENAWKVNTSLEKEFGVASETTAMQMQTFKNNINVVLIELGSKVLPTINDGLKGMIELLNGVNVMKISEAADSINDSTKKLIELRNQAAAAGRDTTNLDKQIKEGLELGPAVANPPSLWETIFGGGSGKSVAGELTGRSAVPGVPKTGTRGFNILGYADGGVVPGPKGSAQLAVVHGGETISPTDKAGIVINFDLRGATMTDKDLINKIKVELNKSLNINRRTN